MKNDKQLKVLFICRGQNGKPGIIIERQAESIKKRGINVDYFLIEEKGLLGYLRKIKLLKKHQKANKYDLFHAHYSYSAFLASFCVKGPLVVSLMGSDVKHLKISPLLIRSFNSLYKWKKVIVKTEELKHLIRTDNSIVIPNGVDLNEFHILEKNDALNELNWEIGFKHVLFAANPKRFEKNYCLSENAIKFIQNKKIILHTLESVNPSKINYYFNASNVIILSSLWEGSPNVIKEAMACCRPIVCTNVGDISWLFGKTPGHYIANFNVSDFADKIIKALHFEELNQKTDGRKRIIELQLDSFSVSEKIIKVYNSNSNE